ncbi:MAG: hypothetical protein EZS28_052449 [Streblomastix strix]|uniref:Uncharacterized protein n=1 Tax=Streblomastix strix TaxID=222440 RepID=A0A5J4S696_9EUKA|nr:MAG: hypothetical protein EZS28_052449 [Streblomastix strix]
MHQYSSFPRRSSDPNERDKDLEQGWEFVDQSSVMPQVRNYKIIQNPPLTLPNKHQSVRQNELHQVPPIPPPPRQDD